jgi:hypothetical protein
MIFWDTAWQKAEWEFPCIAGSKLGSAMPYNTTSFNGSWGQNTWQRIFFQSHSKQGRTTPIVTWSDYNDTLTEYSFGNFTSVINFDVTPGLQLDPPGIILLAPTASTYLYDMNSVTGGETLQYISRDWGMSSITTSVFTQLLTVHFSQNLTPRTATL